MPKCLFYKGLDIEYVSFYFFSDLEKILDITAAGEDAKNLPESYVIFITENGIFGKGLSLYDKSAPVGCSFFINRTIRMIPALLDLIC